MVESNGQGPFPTWIETRIVDAVHVGSLCTGADREASSIDPNARFSLDLIGIKLDGAGNVHVGYVSDLDNHVIVNNYMRQRIADNTSPR